MKGTLPLTIAIALAAALILRTGNASVGRAAAETPLLQSASSALTAPLFAKSNLRFAGAFKVPTGRLGGTAWYLQPGAGAIAYDPADGNLFITANPNANGGINAVAKISVPALGVQTRATALAELPQSVLVSAPVDLTEGTQGLAVDQDVYMGGLLVEGERLYSTQYAVYDAGGRQRLETSSHSRDLTTPGHRGPFHINGGPTEGAGTVSGAMAVVPEAWRSLLGGKIISSQTGISILTRSSSGPNATIWDPANFVLSTPATALLYYHDATGNPHPFTDGHGTSYRSDSSPPAPWPWTEGQPVYWNASHLMRGGGIVIPDGFRSYLSFGCIGRGFYAYGMSDSVNNPPMPPLRSQNGLAGTNASTDRTGRRVTLPNADLTYLDAQGGKAIWLINQSTPVQNPTSNNAVHVGVAQIVGKGNSGLPTAYVDVANYGGTGVFAPNLTNQAYDTGEPIQYDPDREGQGNHGWPYTYIVYAYDLADLYAVKKGTKRPYEVVPYAMWDIRALLPESASSYGQIRGLAWDAAGRRLFLEIGMGTTDYPSIVVLRVDPPSGSSRTPPTSESGPDRLSSPVPGPTSSRGKRAKF